MSVICAFLTDVSWCLTVFLMCLSLTGRNYENCFLCPLAFWISSLVKYLSVSAVHLLFFSIFELCTFFLNLVYYSLINYIMCEYFLPFNRYYPSLLMSWNISPMFSLMYFIPFRVLGFFVYGLKWVKFILSYMAVQIPQQRWKRETDMGPSLFLQVKLKN